MSRCLLSLVFTMSSLFCGLAFGQENSIVADTPGEAAAFQALVAGGGAINQPFDAEKPPTIPAAPRFKLEGGILTTPKKIKQSAIPKAINRIREMRSEVAVRLGAAPAALGARAAAGGVTKIAGVPVGPLPTKEIAPGRSAPLAIPLNSIPTVTPDGWSSHGPYRVGGRIRSIVINPDNPMEMLLGSVSGGIWISTNGGAAWAPVDDFMASIAVSCMIYSPKDPSVVFAGTGEGFGNNAAFLPGAGVFVSKDGGRSWAQLSSTDNPDFEYVNRIAIGMSGNEVTMLVATETGIFRSEDEGQSFTKVVGNDPQGLRCLDVKVHPSDPSKCIATSKTRFGGNDGRVFYSDDGGKTWNFSQGVTDGKRIEVCYSAANPEVVYAVLDRQRGILFRSTDGGKNFQFLSVPAHLGHAVFGEKGSQGWYNNCLWAGHPTNPNIIVVGGIDLHRSVDGGMNFTKISDWRLNNGPVVQSRDEPHSDNHVIVPHPNFDGISNKAVFVGNDGGIFATQDILNAQSEFGWRSLNNGLAISQFYGIGVNLNSGNIAGGLQDNGAVYFDASRPSDGWSWVEGGDGGYAAVDSGNDLYYGEYVRLALHRSHGGEPAVRINQTIHDGAFFIAPFILSPNDSKILYGGGTRLWRSLDATATNPNFQAISPAVTNDGISAIAVRPGNEDSIWLGYGNAIQSPVLKSIRNGNTLSWVPAHGNTLPHRWVSRITFDSNHSNRVYVTFTGYEDDNLYRSDDDGNTWTEISSGLPEIPFRDLAVHPDDSNQLYLATEMGLFVSEDGGGTWTPTNQGPTNTPVYELIWRNRELYAATHGRGVFSIDLTIPPASPRMMPLIQQDHGDIGRVK